MKKRESEGGEEKNERKLGTIQ